ncbi:hypothetical protein SAMN05192561_12015 [Halopenitus malekzadehii]|uniref:Uncharacterized protein n=1 Tax=Halopenitus malekzadehii TaxID=1267564 RepID=A0A1H6JV07_9EURY|nr:hypothetical protein [Halopenitus malekzadehii]SEH64827.1 hypothetical protein SAMN05192561_12015 [Halopenitus malekzadehii]
MSEQHHEDAEHLEDVPAGAGCTEIWETLSERRADGEGRGDEPDETGKPDETTGEPDETGTEPGEAAGDPDGSRNDPDG